MGSLFILFQLLIMQILLKLQDDAKTSFHEDFINLLMYPMTIYKREPAVERVIEFVAKFATSLKQPVDEEESDEDDNSFLLFLFQFLLKVQYYLSYIQIETGHKLLLLFYILSKDC